MKKSLLSMVTVGSLILGMCAGCNEQKKQDSVYSQGFYQGRDEGYEEGYVAGYEDAELHFKCASEVKSAQKIKTPLEKYRDTHLGLEK